jgi:hypothetical protein
MSQKGKGGEIKGPRGGVYKVSATGKKVYKRSNDQTRTVHARTGDVFGDIPKEIIHSDRRKKANELLERGTFNHLGFSRYRATSDVVTVGNPMKSKERKRTKVHAINKTDMRKKVNRQAKQQLEAARIHNDAEANILKSYLKNIMSNKIDRADSVT